MLISTITTQILLIILFPHNNNFLLYQKEPQMLIMQANKQFLKIKKDNKETKTSQGWVNKTRVLLKIKRKEILFSSK